MRERYAIKCPSCKEEALIQRGDTNYECIYCSYRKDLDTHDPSSGSLVIFSFIFFIILLAIVQDFAKQQMPSLSPVDASSPVPTEQRYP